ncbi:MAG: hypothetical protein K6U74_03245 [Firmicutes bacterium]|nr:hypothetical protein [Bacillota bacterium]
MDGHKINDHAGLVLMAWGFASTWHRTGQMKAGMMVAPGRLPGPAAFMVALIG